MNVRLVELPLGSRFRYLNESNRRRVYVLLDRAGCGLVASEPDMHVPLWQQGLFSAADSRAETQTLVVEYVQVRRRHDHGLLLRNAAGATQTVNPGLAQGFVRFGTLAHLVLRHIHEHGPITHSTVAEEWGRANHTPSHIGTCLDKLHKYGYIRRCGSTAYTPGSRCQWLYKLVNPVATYLPPEPTSKVHKGTSGDRTRAYRQGKQGRVASVFDWRGRIPI